MKLHIDTSDRDTVTVTLGKEKRSAQSKKLKSQMVLPLIEEMLRDQKKTLRDISDIQVVTGPGSFTGLRVGVAVANALGYLLGVPVNGSKDIAIPTY